jgi:hypothetical protein
MANDAARFFQAREQRSNPISAHAWANSLNISQAEFTGLTTNRGVNHLGLCAFR